MSAGESTWFVHETAVVDEGAKLSAGVKVWHFCHVSARARLGERVQLGQGCYVAPGVRIGAGTKVQNGVSLYEGVRLHEDVFVGPHAVFTNVTYPRSHVSRRHEFRDTIVHRGATIGANATVVCGCTLGHYSMLGAGSVLTRDTRPFELVAGNPARHMGWVCQCGERLVITDPSIVCSRCETHYQATRDADARVTAITLLATREGEP